MPRAVKDQPPEHGTRHRGRRWIVAARFVNGIKSVPAWWEGLGGPGLAQQTFERHEAEEWMHDKA